MKIKIKELLDLELKKITCAEKSCIDDIPLNSDLGLEVICNVIKNLNGATVKSREGCFNPNGDCLPAAPTNYENCNTCQYWGKHPE